MTVTAGKQFIPCPVCGGAWRTIRHKEGFGKAHVLGWREARYHGPEYHFLWFDTPDGAEYLEGPQVCACCWADKSVAGIGRAMPASEVPLRVSPR